MISGIVLSLAASAAQAGDETAVTRRPPKGSLARQQLLKTRLARIMPTPLSSALSHNRREWDALTPDQRGQYRRSFLAFLHKSPEERTRLLSHYEKLFKMSADRRDAFRRRAKWLKVVVASFTPAERKAMSAMSPTDRARKLLARKAELIHQGKIKPAATAAPTSKPPTTRPAGK